MTFERTSRANHDGAPLWRKDIGEHGNRFDRQLILEPSMSPNPDRGAELHVWVEERRAKYIWVADAPDRRPAGPPTWHVDYAEIESSRRIERVKHPLEYTIICALSKGELSGESAASAVHQLFWMHFVEDDVGLSYLCKYSAKTHGHFYARERLLRYLHYDSYTTRDSNTYEVTSTIEDAMKDHNAALGERFCRTAIADRAVRDAIEAVMLTNESEDVQLSHVRKLVELNATRMDRVIACIIDATRGSHALLGLRACQRVESDPEFFAAADAFVLAHPDGRGMITFLKPHCKPPKTSKPVQEDECYE